MVRKEGAHEAHEDFNVRRQTGEAVLGWLKEENQKYRDKSVDSCALGAQPLDDAPGGLREHMAGGCDDKLGESAVAPRVPSTGGRASPLVCPRHIK